MGRSKDGRLCSLEFEGHGEVGPRRVPEAEALLVGDNGQHVASMASLQVHLNLP